MNDKLQLLESLLPLAALQPLTREAADALPAGQTCNGVMAIHRFPFRIGSESRFVRDEPSGRMIQLERPKMGDRHPTNELYLLDPGSQLNISREHVQISRMGAGYVLTDRGSACGCTVDKIRLGGRDKGGHTFLQDGDIITLGIESSPFQYRFVDLSGVKITLEDADSTRQNLRETASKHSRQDLPASQRALNP